MYCIKGLMLALNSGWVRSKYCELKCKLSSYISTDSIPMTSILAMAKTQSSKNNLYYMNSSMNEQDQSIPALRLATWVGKIALSCLFRFPSVVLVKPVWLRRLDNGFVLPLLLFFFYMFIDFDCISNLDNISKPSLPCDYVMTHLLSMQRKPFF